ncbi:MAG TPA: peptidylprolyl isomerase, partial [Planctomycetota bacterium]|nr:peptidylprolyl isomerase [Planctomycetota bacterium]
LSALGKEEAREYVVRASTTPRGDSEEPQLILARVGGDAITLEELRERIALGYREMIRAERPELPAIEIANRAKELAREALTKPDALRGLVLDTVRTEILYREALESGFGTDAETRTAVEMFRRRLLAERLLASRMQATVQALTPVDYRNHYDANPDRWIEKAKVEFSYAAFPNEPAAKEAIANGVGELTPASGPAREGDPLPGIGRSAEATAHLLALEEGALGDRPIQIGDRWYVFRAEKRHARRKKTFEEAIEEVRADLLQVKEREALSRLEAELSLEFRVWLDEEAIANATKGATEAPPAGDSSKPGGPSDGANASGGASTQDATGAGS